MIIYASNIHVTGGKVLLEELLRSVKGPCLLFAHTKFTADAELPKSISIVRVRPSLLARLAAEWKLKKAAELDSKVICFGNLPPLFRLKAKTFLYFQNTILLKNELDLKFPLKVQLKHVIEKLWLRWGIRNVDTVFVQSQGVRLRFQKQFQNANVEIAPFMEPVTPRTLPQSPTYDFACISSADPHKNLHRLFGAWKLLAQDGLYPSLALTFTTAPQALLTELHQLQQQGLKITNVKEGSREHAFEIYAKSKALIFPSLTESFGMPLIEGAAYGLPILAGELDYVREFVTPVQTFDPFSERSIYRALRRYLLGVSEDVHQAILSPRQFLEMIKI